MRLHQSVVSDAIAQRRREAEQKPELQKKNRRRRRIKRREIRRIRRGCQRHLAKRARSSAGVYRRLKKRSAAAVQESQKLSGEKLNLHENERARTARRQKKKKKKRRNRGKKAGERTEANVPLRNSNLAAGRDR